MQPVGIDLPKSLLPVAGEPLVCRLIRQAQEHGVEHCTVVVGYREDRVRGTIQDHCGDDIEFVSNKCFRDDVNIHSLCLALDADSRPGYVVEADVFLSDDSWTTMLRPQDRGRSVWYVRDRFNAHQMGGILAANDDGAPLRDLRMVPEYDARYADYWKLVGVLKLGPDQTSRFRALLQEYRNTNMRQYYFQPWIDRLVELPSIARNLGSANATSVNTPPEYLALVEDVAVGRR